MEIAEIKKSAQPGADSGKHRGFLMGICSLQGQWPSISLEPVGADGNHQDDSQGAADTDVGKLERSELPAD